MVRWHRMRASAGARAPMATQRSATKGSPSRQALERSTCYCDRTSGHLRTRIMCYTSVWSHERLRSAAGQPNVMRTLLSTRDMRPGDRFRDWQEISRERHIPIRLSRIGDLPFEGEIKVARIGAMSAAVTNLTPIVVSTTPSTIRQSERTDMLALSVMRHGRLNLTHFDRESTHQGGDMVLLDNNVESESHFPDPQGSLVVDINRSRIEDLLGPARLYAGLTISKDLPGASLVKTFFDELVRVHVTLRRDMAERMASIGTDLLVASIAERMAIETPRPLQGTITVQRAKAFIEANLGDPSLDPVKVAAAVGVSLRHIHGLFRGRGRNVADHIWV